MAASRIHTISHGDIVNVFHNMCCQAQKAIAAAEAELQQAQAIIDQQKQVALDAAEAKRVADAKALAAHYQEIQAQAQAALVSSNPFNVSVSSLRPPAFLLSNHTPRTGVTLPNCSLISNPILTHFTIHLSIV